MSRVSGTITVGALVTEHPIRARLFERHGIDFCCGGGKTIYEVCQDKGLDPQILIDELCEFDGQTPDEDASLESLLRGGSLTELVNHIEMTHHAYLKERLPALVLLMDNVARVHGERKPYLILMRQLVNSIVEELLPHMMKEEQVLFPMIRRLEESDQLPWFHCGSIQNPMRVMEMEHEQAGELLRRIRHLSEDYKVPADSCNSFRALYAYLAELESDLHIHIHKENNILHPRVRELEAKLTERDRSCKGKNGVHSWS